MRVAWTTSGAVEAAVASDLGFGYLFLLAAGNLPRSGSAVALGVARPSLLALGATAVSAGTAFGGSDV